jgi:hypothetical protein
VSYTGWKTVTTTAGGTFSASAAPVAKTYYRARFYGDAAFVGVSSPAKSVLPKVYLTRPSGPRSVGHGAVFAAKGTLKPRHSSGTKPVKVQCYKRVGGSWKLRATYSAKAANAAASSSYKASVKLPSAGRWRIRAYYPTSSTNYRTYSNYRYVRAR